ncbi:transmembrane protein 116 isoform X3 [Phycodurus eques]|uniref:transmembrane protein 116 isoform X3 n=1 Tax=Phycodurus eques TaxID=693459 RepID=UPI002ACED088|nr:transmembrane protein 116 isoform X3 [Phycodurus eques]
MEGAFAQHNASGTHDWTRVGSALPWIHVIAALVSALGSASVITRVTSQRVGGATSEVSVRVGAVSRRRRDLCGVVAGASALPAGRIRPAARPLRTARGRDARAPRRRPRLVPPARRATGRVYRVLLLHAQLRVERVRSAASQPLVRPSPAFCAVRDAKWQDDRTAFWRGSASPDGARLHRRKRRRLRRRLRRPLQMSADARRRASCRRRATDRGLPAVAHLRRRRLPRRLLAHARRHVAACLVAVRATTSSTDVGGASVVVLYVAQAVTSASPGVLRFAALACARGPPGRIPARRDADAQTPLLRAQKTSARSYRT